MFLAFLAFFGIALPDGVFGVSWPSMRLDLGVPLGALGIMLPFGVVASILSSSATGFVLGRIGIGWLLAVSTALAGTALFVQSLATAFWVLVAASCLFGAGSGAIDAGLNAHVARRFRARQITWLHACYGVGAACGPLIVAGAAGLGLSWRWAFGTVAAIQGALALAFALTARGWATPAAKPQRPVDAAPPGAAPVAGDTAAGGRSVPRLALPGIVLFAVHNGLEATTSLWAYVYLTAARGIRPTTAALLVSGYWLALLVGRIVLGPIADRTGARPMLLACLGGIVAGAGLLFLPGAAAAAGVLGLGLAVAPVFPLLTLTTKDRVGEHHADRVIGLQVAAGAAGATAIPAVIGVLIDRVGAGVLAPCLVTLAVVTVTTYLAVTGRSRRPPRVARGEPRSVS
jgi:MFS family permease